MFKKKLIVTIPLVISSLGVTWAQADPEADTLKIVTRTDFAFLELLGVSYQREIPISRRNVLIFNPKAYYDFYYGNGVFGQRFGHSLSLGLTVGSRHYYRLRPRARQTNTGNYVGMDFGIKSSPLIQRNVYFTPVLFLNPYWGLRRNLGRRTVFELGLGLTFKKDLGEYARENMYLSPSIQLGFGWRL